MVKRQYINTLIFILLAVSIQAQTGGQHIYQFLNLSPGARIAALGGMPVAWKGEDPGASYLNPSLLSEGMSGKIYFSHQYYFDDISSGHVSYTHFIPKLKLTTQAGVQFVNHGDLVRTDIYGNMLGDFTANENSFYIGASKTIQERLSVGANFQFISSKLDVSTSTGFALSAGVLYHNPIKNMDFSLVFKNTGIQLSKYNQETEILPFEIQIAFAKKLKHLPLIYHITFQHLEKWDVTYDDPANSNAGFIFNDATSDKTFEDALSNFLRHFVFGAELNFGKTENFSVRLGYNPLRSYDLSLNDYRSFSGLSVGFGIKIYKFKFDYSYSKYHLAGGTSQITLSTNINSFVKKEM